MKGGISYRPSLPNPTGGREAAHVPGEEPAAKPAKTLHAEAPGLPRTPTQGPILGADPLIFHLVNCQFDI